MRSTKTKSTYCTIVVVILISIGSNSDGIYCAKLNDRSALFLKIRRVRANRIFTTVITSSSRRATFSSAFPLNLGNVRNQTVRLSTGTNFRVTHVRRVFWRSMFIFSCCCKYIRPVNHEVIRSVCTFNNYIYIYSINLTIKFLKKNRQTFLEFVYKHARYKRSTAAFLFYCCVLMVNTRKMHLR